MASPLLLLGYVARAHGLRGEVAIRPFDSASQSLFEVDHVVLRHKSGEERTYAIEEARQAKEGALLALVGVEGRTAAEGLTGAQVFVAREELSPLEPGQFFQGDLVGLSAFDESGRALGRVEEVWNTGPVPNLVIRSGAEELIIPFADPFVPTVDLEAGRLVVRKPEWVE